MNSDTPDAKFESPELDAAARWWAAHLGDKKQDAGDAKINAAASMFHCAPAPTDEQKESFILSFVQSAEQRCNPRHPRLTIGVDYGPDQLLCDAAKDAEYPITNGSFPIKTWMQVTPGSVTVSHGYGAAAVAVYQSDEEKISDRQHEIDAGRRLP